MICELCHKNEAAVFIEMQGPGVPVRKVSICPECAVKYGFDDQPKFVKKLYDEILKQNSVQNKNLNKACPVCGIKLSQILKEGVAGCPECYAIFKTDIQEFLQKRGISGSYTGTMPKRLSTFRSILVDRIVLQSKLEQAISEEDYEKAAIYRDYLKALEKSSVEGADDE